MIVLTVKTWTPERLPVGVIIAGERIICHDRCVDALGRWFGLIKLGVESEHRFPDLATWSTALKGRQLLLHYYTRRSGERSFSGRLWIFYKEQSS